MAQEQMTPQQQNAMARYNLLTTGISMTKRLQPVVGQLGSQIRIPLQRMGIMTGVMLQFSIPVTIADFDSLSLLAPFNIAQNVTYTDFAGVNRTRTNGFQLWAAQSFKQGDALGSIGNGVGASGSNAPALNYDTNILNIPAADGEGVIYFSLYVPMAYDPSSDLTGAVLTQTNVGEHFITIDLPASLSGADKYKFPYGAGTSVTVNGGVTVEAFQHYIQPQAMNASFLPLIDLSTIYGFEGGYQTTANIAANQSTFVNFPNNRAILSTLIQYQNGNGFTANGTDLSGITLLANSNTNFREYTPRMLREIQRNLVNSDMPDGTYYIGSRRQPILTQLYANVQAKMDILSAAANSKLIAQYEVQYASGAPLPGITAGSA